MDAIKIKATLFGNEDFSDEEQVVDIEYSGHWDWNFIVDYLKVLTPIELEPGDLYTDLADAIANHQHAVMARIECEIELTELVRNF